MRCGLYGKLPAKRDFIAQFAPRSFLGIWEPWIQGGVSASRQSLGEAWQQAFLTAPIWRFWLGKELCGTTVTGAFMPSLDGVGRYFPLTLFVCADEQAAIPPPELNAQDEWFAQIEEFLLSTLDQDATFESISAALDALSAPSDCLPTPERDSIIAAAEETVALPTRERAFPEVFASVRAADHANVYSAATFWWTIGGEGYEPLVMAGRRMPDPFVFAQMLTGRFSAESLFASSV